MFQAKKIHFSYEGYLTKFAGSTSNHENIIGTPNQPIETKKFRKKTYILYHKSEKDQKICIEATRRNLQAQP
jgi:hypothetical protein